MRHLLKVLSSCAIPLLALAVWAGLPNSSSAQSNLLVAVFPSTTNAIPVNSSLSYTIFLTNNSTVILQNTYVTNSLPDSAQILGSTNVTSPGNVSTNGTRVIFFIPQMLQGTFARMGLSVRPTASGAFTNLVTVFSPQLIETNILVTAVSQVTNLPAVQTDLALAITGPGPDVYTGDWTTFKVVITNNGPNTASNVLLSSSFSPAVKWISPANQTTNSSLGTLTNQGSRTVSFTVQPTNAGTFSFLASVSSAAEDTSPANNTATNSIEVSAFLTNTLIASVVSTQTFNGVMGVFDQQIAVSNASPADVPSARINVSGIPSANRLFNASGTNNGIPFVVYPTNITAGQSVELTLQFRIPSFQTFTNFALAAAAMTNAADLTPPVGLIPLPPTLGFTNFTRITNWAGNMLLEFPSTNGRNYTIVYSDDAAFTSPKVARPSIVAPANWTYWVDYGPPATISRPSEAPSRFYRVYLNP